MEREMWNRFSLWGRNGVIISFIYLKMERKGVREEKAVMGVKESTPRSWSFSRSSSHAFVQPRFPLFAGRWKSSDRAPLIISVRLDEETEPALAKTS